MALIKYKPRTPGTRAVVKVDRSHLHKGAPHMALTAHQSKTGGRNHFGRITTRHHGGGMRQKYRIIDFKRDKDSITGVVERIEYDPNRTRAHLIARLHALGRQDVAPLAVGVPDERDVASAVRVVLDPLDDAGDAVLVALEVDDAVLLAHPAAMMARRDAAEVVAAPGRALVRGERHVRGALVQVRAVDLHHRAGAGSSGLVLDEGHGRLPIPSDLGAGFVIDRLTRGEAHVGLLPVLGAALEAAEAPLLARLVDDLNSRDLDIEHELDRLPDVGLGRFPPHAEGVLVVVLHRERSFLGDVRGDQNTHQLLAVHCRRSSMSFTAPTVISTLS